MRINRNYRSTNAVRTEMYRGNSVEDNQPSVSGAQYEESRQELKRVREKYELYQMAEKRIQQMEEEQESYDQRIRNILKELDNGTVDACMMYDLDEINGALKSMQAMREQKKEDRKKKGEALIRELADKEELCRKCADMEGEK